MRGMHATGGQRVLARFAQHRAEKIGHRGDLWIADKARAGRNAARLLIGYSEVSGAPSVGDIEAFVHRTFDGRLRVQASTQRLHEESGAVELIAAMWSPKRSYGDRRQMVQLSPGVYADHNTRTGEVSRDSIWHVVRDADGQPHMQRQSADDIDGILAERKQRLTNDSRGLSFASLPRTAGVLQLTVGDTVRFYADDQTLVGQVVGQQGGENWRIRAATGLHTVPKAAVVDVVQKGQTREAADEQKLVDYYSKAFGDREYAEQLVNPKGSR